MTYRIPNATRYYRNPGVVSLDTFHALLERYEALERERDEARRQSDRFCDKYLAALSRAEAAEAKLAEAMKALRMMLKEHDILSGNFGDVMDPKHKRPDCWPTAAEAARKLLKENGNGE